MLRRTPALLFAVATLTASCTKSDEPAASAIEAGPPRGPHEAGPGHTVNYPTHKPREIKFAPWRGPLPRKKEATSFVAPPSFEAISGLTKNRCPEGTRNRLLAYDRDKLVLDLGGKEAAEKFGPVQGLEKPFRNPHFALAALLKGRDPAVAVELWPCDGDPVKIRIADVVKTPARYVLVLTNRRGFKLADARTGATLLRSLAAVRIVR